MRSSNLLPIRGEDLVLERQGRRLIDAMSLTLGSDGTLVLMGPNGSGKSLALRMLTNLVTPDSGSVTWAGRPPDLPRARHIGFVLQRPVLLRRTVLENVLYPLHFLGLTPQQRRTRAEEAMAAAGLLPLAASPARVLSGGEQRRLAIARAFATRPEILILDEPAANLDPASTAAVEALIRTARGEGIPVVLVTHDVGQARRLADEVVFINRGRVTERSPAAQFFATPRTAEARAYLAGEIVL